MLVILDKLCKGFILYSLANSSPDMALSLEPLASIGHIRRTRNFFVNHDGSDYCELEERYALAMRVFL